MKKVLLFVLIIFSFVQLQAQNNVLWQRVGQNSAISKGQLEINDGKLYYSLNASFLKQKLAGTLSVGDKKITTEVTFPNSKGVLERFAVWESSNFDPVLQAKYPEIRAYEGTGLDDKTAKIHFSISPIGLQTMVIRADRPLEYIEENPENKQEYVVFASNKRTRKQLICKTDDDVLNKNTWSKTAKTTSNNKVFKTMRLALSCTSEYTSYFGGTKAGALAGMNATMTRVNGILNKDLTLKLVIISNNDAVIYTDATTDPYSNASVGADGAWNQQVQTTLTNVIGDANYDIGHLFGASGGGGNVGCIGCVCDDPTSSFPDAKGSAYTSPSDGNPKGDSFDVDLVIHEMGHQLGANHTFSFDGVERTDLNVEPGSGSTIMAYAGITSDYYVQNASDAYFAYASISQIQNNLATKSCPVTTTITNNPPTINAGADYTIPKSTAFVLIGTGSDPEGDAITYTWEQYDNAVATFGATSIAYPTKPDGPLFRSLLPSSSPTRYMPGLTNVVQNRLTTTWESISSIARTLHFTLIGRDNAAFGSAQTNIDSMIVTVNAAAGPFAITSQNTDNISWANASQQLVTWSVNNTASLPGSSAVNIKLSIDAGLTFSTILVANTPNDGSEVITVPADVKATNCRILIEPTANIYYAVNSMPFSIGYASVTNCNSYSFGNAFTIPYSNGFTSKTITVPASAKTVSDVNIAVNVTYASMSDLEFQLVSPKGTVVQLFSKACAASSNQNLILQFVDSGAALNCVLATQQIVIPSESLAAFNGENVQGTLTFRVRDIVAPTSGTINSVSLDICDKTYTLGVKETENLTFVLYPNPNKGNFTVQFSSDSISEIKIFVHDMVGKRLYAKTFERTSVFSQEIQSPSISSGVYLVTVEEGNKKIVKKIVIE